MYLLIISLISVLIKYIFTFTGIVEIPSLFVFSLVFLRVIIDLILPVRFLCSPVNSALFHLNSRESYSEDLKNWAFFRRICILDILAIHFEIKLVNIFAEIPCSIIVKIPFLYFLRL